jgi:uncharacterized protein YbaA (DUF1428 family)
VQRDDAARPQGNETSKSAVVMDILSRNVRDEAMKKVMADPRLKPDVNPMPFDGKRMIYGGFEMIVEA